MSIDETLRLPSVSRADRDADRAHQGSACDFREDRTKHRDTACAKRCSSRGTAVAASVWAKMRGSSLKVRWTFGIRGAGSAIANRVTTRHGAKDVGLSRGCHLP
jgi:hypothetical protein